MRRAIAFIVIAALAIAACGDGDEAAPDATVTPTLTPVPEATATSEPTPGEQPGADGFHAFAAQIQEAIDTSNASFFLDRARTTDVLCTEEDVEGGIGAPACDFAGQRYDGLTTGHWRSHGGLVPVQNVAPFAQELGEQALPEAQDEFGDGALRVYALAIDEAEADAISAAIIERPADFAGEGPLRVARVTSWSHDGERWRFTSLLDASVLAEEFLAPCPEALNYLAGAWERYPDPDAPAVGEPACSF